LYVHAPGRLVGGVSALFAIVPALESETYTAISSDVARRPSAPGVPRLTVEAKRRDEKNELGCAGLIVNCCTSRDGSYTHKERVTVLTSVRVGDQETGDMAAEPGVYTIYCAWCSCCRGFPPPTTGTRW